MKHHVEDPEQCWCLPAVRLTIETKTVVHRWTLRDTIRLVWFTMFGWPTDPAKPLGPLERRRVEIEDQRHSVAA